MRTTPLSGYPKSFSGHRIWDSGFMCTSSCLRGKPVTPVTRHLQDSWSKEELAACNINELELAASTFGLVSLGPETNWTDVYSWTDNTSAMFWMRGSSPTSVAAHDLSAARVDWMMSRGISESAERITSEANLWADQGSRGDIRLVIRDAEAMSLRPRRVAIPGGWRALLTSNTSSA